MIEERQRHATGVLMMLIASLWMPLALSAQTAAGSAAPAVPGNNAGASAPVFEVVSIKPDKSGTMMMRVMFTSDGISVIGFPLHMLLREAFDISDNQLVAEPGWLTSDRFDIEAKVAVEDVPKLKALKPTERWAMLLPVFEDRFALKFHHESRDLTQYVLVAASSGLKMKEATSGETYPNGLKTPDGKAGGAGMMRVEPGAVIGQGVSIANLVRYLSFQLHSPVTDKTNLTGKYDIDLKWAPDEMEGPTPRSPDDGEPGAGNPASTATTGPSLFTALEEQLGLKLESHKEPADVIVIDHIEQPSPN